MSDVERMDVFAFRLHMILEEGYQTAGADIGTDQEIGESRDAGAAEAHQTQRLTGVAEEVARDVQLFGAIAHEKRPPLEAAPEVEVQAIVAIEIRRD